MKSREVGILLDVLRKRFVAPSKQAPVEARVGFEAAEEKVGGDRRVWGEVL